METKQLGIALGEVMSGLTKKWEIEKQYNQKDIEKVKSGEHKLWFGIMPRSNLFRYRSEWSLMWKAWQDKHSKRIHISYGLGIEHKQMSAKVQRRILDIDEEILNLGKKKNRILKKHFQKAKTITDKQILNRANKLYEIRKELKIN